MTSRPSWEFDAHYGRTGTIRRTFLTCHVCKKDGDGISIDSSEGEYGPGNICRDCIDLAFSERINI